MRIYILRHGPAAPRDEAGPGSDDASRALTPEGKKKTRRAARGMRALGVEADLVLTSPLVRARETAEIAASELRVPPPEVRETASLEPGAPPSAAIEVLAGLDPAAAVLLVGHEPDLSRLASFFLTGEPDGVGLVLKKPGLCAIEVDGAPRPGARGTLLFLLQPGQLRAAAKS